MSSEQFEKFEELGRRAVACERWRWMPGMRYQVSGTVGRLTDSQCKGKLPLVAEAVPDLNDPATLGCLLALVRAAWKKPHAYVEFSDKWEVAFYFDVGTHAFSSTTEASVLVSALKAAP